MRRLKLIGFYLLSFTWGILMTLFGCVVALALLLTGHKPHMFHGSIYFEAGSNNWGGFECGPFFVTDRSPTLHIKQHEAGHGLQNIMFGPLMPFLISIPSCIRYWLRECKTYEKKRLFVLFFFLISVIISATMSTIGFFFCSVLMHIFNCVTVYLIPLLIWLAASELPKYSSGNYVDYDSIWFEGMATKLGKKYFK